MYDTDIPIRAGYCETVTPWKRRKNAGYNAYLTRICTSNYAHHEVQRNMDMLKFLGGEYNNDFLELFCDERISRKIVPAGKDFAGLVIGGREEVRRWPAEQFADLATRLHKDYGLTSVLIGDRNDRTTAQTILKKSPEVPIIDLTGKTSLPQIAWLGRKKLRVAICNDTGAMHILVAVGTPIIEISCHPLDGDPLWVRV